MTAHHDFSALATTTQWTPRVVSDLATVLSNEALTPEYRHLVVVCGELSSKARAGQFFQLLCPAGAGEAPFLRRPMSLFRADPDKRTVEFLYKVTGIGTRGLQRLRPGDQLDMLGPLGTGFTVDTTRKSLVLVARGAGLATLAPVAEEACKAGIAVTALFSAKRPDLSRLEELIRSFGANVITVTDLDGSSDPANVEHILRDLIATDRCKTFATCGSARLIRLQQRLAHEFDLSGQAAMEEQMACGMGLCFCCVREFETDGAHTGQRVCCDGPVFDLREVTFR